MPNFNPIKWCGYLLLAIVGLSVVASLLQQGDSMAALGLLMVLFALVLLPLMMKALIRMAVKVLVVLLALVCFLAVLSQIPGSENPVAALSALALVSWAAYQVRESRLRRRQALGLRAVERTPVLPHQAVER